MKRSGVLMLLLAVTLMAGCASQTTGSGNAANSPQEALEAYTNLGLQYLQAGNTVSAKTSVQRAIAIDSGYAPAYNAMALIFQTEQEFELAEEYFRKAMSTDKTSAMIHNNYGAFLFSQQRYGEACEQLNQATTDPFYQQRAQAFENLGRCYLLIDTPEKAEEAFRRSLAINGNRPVALVELSGLLLDKGENAASNRLFERFRELVDQQRTEHSSRSLWLGIRLARAERNVSRAATYALLLKNLYPKSQEYRLYEETAQ